MCKFKSLSEMFSQPILIIFKSGVNMCNGKGAFDWELSPNTALPLISAELFDVFEPLFWFTA